MTTPPPLALIAVRPEDHPCWLPLWRGYQSFYRVDIPEQVSDVTWSRLLDPGEPVYGVLAWRDGRAVGLVHYIPHRSTWFTGEVCYLQDLYVDPEARGGGIGRRLIEHVYAQAEARGWRRVHWLTHETNADAMQLYDRIADRSGFVQFRKNFPG